MGEVSATVSIGEFSRLSHLTVKSLRHYHDVGLLVPDQVDDQTGYRRYGTGQVDAALLIGRLRGLDMPLPAIGQVLAAPDPAERDALLAAHLRRMERELERTRDIVSALRELLEPAPPPPIEFRTLPGLRVLAVRERVGRDDVVAWCVGAFQRLAAALPDGTRSAEPVGATYADGFFTEGVGDVVAFLPVAADAPVGATWLPGGRFAVGLHAGAYAGMDRTYAALGAHVAEHAEVAPGPIRERYLVGPDRADTAAALRTEICWPVAG